MTRLQKARTMHKLEDFAAQDGFEFVGEGLVLFFVTGRDTEPVRRDFVLCSFALEARREIKARRADGWRCCWKAFGQVYLPGEIDL